MLITTWAFQLQMTLFNCIEHYLDVYPPGGIVHLSPCKNENDSTIHFTWKGNLSDSADFVRLITNSANWPVIQTLAHGLGGKAEFVEADLDMILSLPGEIPRDRFDKNH